MQIPLCFHCAESPETLELVAMASNLRVHLKHCFSPPSLRSYFAEFISTFLFVFTAVGSAISASTSTDCTASTRAAV